MSSRSVVRASFALALVLTTPAQAAPPTVAPIRLHADNPRLFLFRDKPTVLVGSTEHYGAVLNLDFDYVRYLDELKDKGLNLTRIFTGSYVELPGAFGIEKNTLAPLPGRFSAPWARSTTPGYANGGNKFDLSRWDAAYFARLNDFVAEAGKRGIVVEVTLFSALYGSDGWNASPMNPKNNITGGAAVDRRKVHTLDNAGLLAHQERLVRKVVSELREADNVIYEIQNEPWADLGANSSSAGPASGVSLAWQRQIAAFIANEETKHPARHLIAENVANHSHAVTDPDPNVSILNFHYCRPPEAVRLNADLRRVIGFDETGFDGAADATYRTQAWDFLLAGGALFDHLDYSFTTARENGTDVQKAPGGGSPALRTQLGILKRFLDGLGEDLPLMRPADALYKGGNVRARVLAAPGRAVAAYLTEAVPSSKETRVALELPFGAFTAEWMNTRTGVVEHSERFAHAGGVRELKGPVFAEDIAVRVRRSTTMPTAEELPKGSVWPVIAPGGKLRIVVALADLAGWRPATPPGKRLWYTVEHGEPTGRVTVLPWSPLGVSRADESFVEGLSFVSTQERTVNDAYTLMRGKQRQVKASGKERSLTLANAHGARLELDVRAYDDGVAFRYRFPDKREGVFQVTGEATGFQLPADARATMTPHSEPSLWTPAYEEMWQADLPVGTSSSFQAGWSFPALFRVGTRWALVTEAGLDASYFGARLGRDAPDALYRVRMPDAQEGEGSGELFPRSTLPWTLPWRVIMVGEGLAPIVESNLVTTLAPASKVKDTRWIQPGRASWSWWSDPPSPKRYERMLPFIDLAAEMGWEYFLVDANWNDMVGGTWKDIVEYAKKKNVRILLWYNSGGPNNKVTEAPRDRMFERDKRRAEMKMLSEAGVAGIKVDFFQSDKQATIAEYLDILEDAAAFKLLVNFHGCTLPRGWERTYPNLMGHEAVKGAEQYLGSARFAAGAPAHNTILPFTRNAVGPMDYTPVTFSFTKHPHKTTNAHELALAVLYENGLQHFADSVGSYRTLTDPPRDFLKAVPAVWDETRLAAGEPGKLAVLARRNGKGWWVGGINGEGDAKTVDVSLAFTGKGKAAFDVTVIADGDTDNEMRASNESKTSAETISVKLRGNGGFVMRLMPKK